MVSIFVEPIAIQRSKGSRSGTRVRSRAIWRFWRASERTSDRYPQRRKSIRMATVFEWSRTRRPSDGGSVPAGISARRDDRRLEAARHGACGSCLLRREGLPATEGGHGVWRESFSSPRRSCHARRCGRASGLAESSRNRLLSPEARERAAWLFRALTTAANPAEARASSRPRLCAWSMSRSAGEGGLAAALSGRRTLHRQRADRGD